MSADRVVDLDATFPTADGEPTGACIECGTTAYRTTQHGNPACDTWPDCEAPTCRRCGVALRRERGLWVSDGPTAGSGELCLGHPRPHEPAPAADTPAGAR